MRELAVEFAGRAQFAFVYGPESHPLLGEEGAGGDYLRDGRPLRAAVNLAERSQAAALLRDRVEPERRLLVDGFGKDSLYARLFVTPSVKNALVVVSPGGRVVFVCPSASADEVEEFLKGRPGA